MAQFINTNNSKVLKANRKSSWNAKSSTALKRKFFYLAKKYYGTDDISKLQPYQIDKITTWTLGTSPDKGKSQSRKYQQALTGNTKYLNSNAKTYRAQKNKTN